MEALKNMYQPLASNMGHAQKKRDTKAPIPDRKLSEGDTVLLKDHTASVWDPRYTRGYGIVSFPGKTQFKVADSKGKAKLVHISDIQYVLPVDRVISKLPYCQSFGRQSRLRIDLKDIPNLKWESTVTITTNFLAVSSKLGSTTSVMDSLNPIPLVFTMS